MEEVIDNGISSWLWEKFLAMKEGLYCGKNLLKKFLAMGKLLVMEEFLTFEDFLTMEEVLVTKKKVLNYGKSSWLLGEVLGYGRGSWSW
jgi:hypothetical protein